MLIIKMLILGKLFVFKGFFYLFLLLGVIRKMNRKLFKLWKCIGNDFSYKNALKTILL